MRSSRNMMFAGVLGAASLAGAVAIAAVPDPWPEEAERGSSRRNKPSGSKPVSGGGARERARRLAKMAKPYPQDAEGRDIIPDENQF